MRNIFYFIAALLFVSIGSCELKRDNETIFKVEIEKINREHSDSLTKAYIDEISKMDIAEQLKDTTPMSKEEAARFDSLNKEGNYLLIRGSNRYLDTIVNHIHYICITEE